jgi:hypothetical protein
MEAPAGSPNMTDPVFVKTRHEYASYRDIWELVDLAGIPTCYVDEIDAASDRTYILIVRNGEWPEGGWPNARARIIHWHMEFHVQYDPLPGVGLWSPDAWHAERIGGRYVPVGSDARLKHGPDTRFAHGYDVAYLGYLIPRRTDILSGLAQRGVRVSPTSAWGDERHAILTHATAYLHVHQEGSAPAVPALRMVVAAAYSLPVIMETPARRGIFQYGHMLTSDHAHLAEFAEMWAVRSKGPFLQGFGDSLHRHLCHDLTFRRSVEAAL